ncbi:MAG: hypothetical protein R3B72_05900 [Polyangiaceae bacterium]
MNKENAASPARPTALNQTMMTNIAQHSLDTMSRLAIQADVAAHAVLTLTFRPCGRGGASEHAVVASVRQFLDRLSSAYGHVSAAVSYQLIEGASWHVRIAVEFENAPDRGTLLFGLAPLQMWAAATWPTCHALAAESHVKIRGGRPKTTDVAFRGAVVEPFKVCPSQVQARYRHGPHRGEHGCPRRNCKFHGIRRTT